jgi:hypothetical protein
VKQSVVIMDWIVVERVVHLGKRSNDEDQQYHDQADFLENAHDSLFDEYPWRVWVLATSGVFMPDAPRDLTARRKAIHGFKLQLVE